MALAAAGRENALTASLFLEFVVVVVLLLIAIARHFLPRKSALALAGGLLAWLCYVGLLGRIGILADVSLRPQGLALILGPVLLFEVGWVMWSQSAKRVALAVPVAVLVGFQVFRIPVELFIHQLNVEGLVPEMLTFRGANIDILAGITAPVAAWLATRGPTGRKWALLWNVAGVLTLANIVVRFILTVPGPLNLLHLEIENRAGGTFPYMFLPGFLAPLALTLHILTIRSLRARMTSVQPVPLA